MALKLATVKMEDVEIDGQVFTPDMTVERRMRLARAASKNNDDFIETIAECFGEAKEAVREKLKGLSVTSVCELQVYLLEGDAGVEKFHENTGKGEANA